MQQQLITQQTLIDAGINIPATDIDAYIQQLNDTLEERITIEVLSYLTDEQTADFMKATEEDDADNAFEWLLQNVPDLLSIVDDEIDIFLGEL